MLFFIFLLFFSCHIIISNIVGSNLHYIGEEGIAIFMCIWGIHILAFFFYVSLQNYVKHFNFVKDSGSGAGKQIVAHDRSHDAQAFEDFKFRCNS